MCKGAWIDARDYGVSEENAPEENAAALQRAFDEAARQGVGVYSPTCRMGRVEMPKPSKGAESSDWPEGGLPHGEHPYDYGYGEQPKGASEYDWRHPLHSADRALLHVCEFFFGPRDSWEWWRRKLRKRGLLDE